MEAAGGTIACPSCHAPLVVDTGYVTWCDACEWGLEPRRDGAPPGARELRRRERALRRAQRVFEEVAGRLDREERFDAGRLLTFAISTLVLLIAPAMLVGAVVLAFAGGIDGVHVALALLLAAAALAVRPRLGRLPRKQPLLTRGQAPALFGLLDRIAAATGAQTPAWVEVRGDYNAWQQYVGVRRRSLLHVGAGLWAMLDQPQRVALLGHELAHDVNGDLSHGVVVGGALGTLHELRMLFAPSRVPRRFRRSVRVSRAANEEAVAEAIARAIGSVFGAAGHGLSLLVVRNKQRAEYRADAVAARAGGTEAAVQALEATMLAPSCAFALERARVRGETVDSWALLRSHLQGMPARERERVRRVAARQGTSVDDTHPPTPLRLDMLRRGPRLTAEVVMGAGEAEAIDAEIRAALRQASRD